MSDNNQMILEHVDFLEKRIEWVESLLNREALISHNHVVTRDGLFISVKTENGKVVSHSTSGNPYECSHLTQKDAETIAAVTQNGNGFFEAVHINKACRDWLKETKEHIEEWKGWVK